MSQDSEDKQHLPSPKRMAELRKEGRVLRSRDLTTGVTFIVTVGMLFYMAKSIGVAFQEDYIWAFKSISNIPSNPDYIFIFIKSAFIKNLKLLIPFFISLIAVTLFSPFLFGGWNFTLKAIQFNLGKLNPLNNIKAMFGFKHMAFEIVKSMLKAFFLLSILIMFILNHKNEIARLTGASYSYSINIGSGLLKEYVVMISAALIFLIALDVIYNYVKYQNQIKMSAQELKDEAKQGEGSGETKRRIRSMRMALLKQSLSKAVPTANVIVTNPTHYAIALKYNSDKDHAPKVVAKGKDILAQQIRLLAVANGIPIYEAPLLARALYRTADIGSHIHPDLYMAVAIVLSYVHQLKNYQHGIGHAPVYVKDLKIPEDFIYDE
ncbi:MAG: EscU/YscU/HrcU family type III secretion system export apparatus switch protein [Gammaproteobacteria bacterium]